MWKCNNSANKILPVDSFQGIQFHRAFSKKFERLFSDMATKYNQTYLKINVYSDFVFLFFS